MGSDYQQLPMHRGSLRAHSSGPSKMTTYLLVALGITALFFAYQSYAISLERDALSADLVFQMRKVATIEQEKRELASKNEELGNEHQKEVAAKEEDKNQMTLKDGRISELEEATDKARRSLEECEVSKNRLDTELTEAKARIEKMETDNTQQIHLLQGQVAELQSEKDVNTQELEKLRSELLQAQKAKEEEETKPKEKEHVSNVQPLQDFAKANQEQREKKTDEGEDSNAFDSLRKENALPLAKSDAQQAPKPTPTPAGKVEEPNPNAGNLPPPRDQDENGVPAPQGDEDDNDEKAEPQEPEDQADPDEKRLPEYQDGRQHNSGVDDNKAQEADAPNKAAGNDAKEEDDAHAGNNARETDTDQ